MENLHMFIQDRIRYLRHSKNVSARELSLAIGQGHAYISQIENGLHLPSIEGLSYICDYFNISLADFFNNELEYPEIVKEVVELALTIDKDILLEFISLIKKINGIKKN